MDDQERSALQAELTETVQRAEKLRERLGYGHAAGHDPLGDLIATAQQRTKPVARKVAFHKPLWTPVCFQQVGREGEICTVQVQPQRLFRGEELFAMDDSTRPGHGTEICGIFVGNLPVIPPFVSNIPTWMFYEWMPPEDRQICTEQARLNGTEFETPTSRAMGARLRLADAAMKLPWPSCDPALSITFQIRFRTACRWTAVLWGRALDYLQPPASWQFCRFIADPDRKCGEPADSEHPDGRCHVHDDGRRVIDGLVVQWSRAPLGCGAYWAKLPGPGWRGHPFAARVVGCVVDDGDPQGKPPTAPHVSFGDWGTGLADCLASGVEFAPIHWPE